MAKDPAFLFYPGDWLSGTMYLTHEQKGAYMDLLILQFNCGKFTETQAKQVLSICFDVAWVMLKQKFKKEGEFYYNERLSLEIEKRKNFTQSRRDNASGSKKPKSTTIKPKKNDEHMLEHMEDENKDINDNIDLIDFKNKKNELCILLVDFFEFNGNHFNRQRMEISGFVESQIVDESFYNHFIQQFKDYQEYKKLSGEQKHHFDTYLGKQSEQFLDGQWNKENWGAKIIKFKGQNKSKTDQIDDAFNQTMAEHLKTMNNGNSTV